MKRFEYQGIIDNIAILKSEVRYDGYEAILSVLGGYPSSPFANCPDRADVIVSAP